MDLTALPRKSTLLREAEAHGCTVVLPRTIMLKHLQLLTRLIAGRDVARERLEETWKTTVGEED